MRIKTVLIKGLFASGAIMLLFSLSSCKKEVFTSGVKNEFSLQSAANGASYNIKVGLPANYNSSDKYAGWERDFWIRS